VQVDAIRVPRWTSEKPTGHASERAPHHRRSLLHSQIPLCRTTPQPPRARGAGPSIVRIAHVSLDAPAPAICSNERDTRRARRGGHCASSWTRTQRTAFKSVARRRATWTDGKLYHGRAPCVTRTSCPKPRTPPRGCWPSAFAWGHCGAGVHSSAAPGWRGAGGAHAARAAGWAARGARLAAAAGRQRGGGRGRRVSGSGAQALRHAATSAHCRSAAHRGRACTSCWVVAAPPPTVVPTTLRWTASAIRRSAMLWRRTQRQRRREHVAKRASMGLYTRTDSYTNSCNCGACAFVERCRGDTSVQVSLTGDSRSTLAGLLRRLLLRSAVYSVCVLRQTIRRNGGGG
jgi:hypothetical protein